jgi:hypothetical protein
LGVKKSGSFPKPQVVKISFGLGKDPLREYRKKNFYSFDGLQSLILMSLLIVTPDGEVTLSFTIFPQMQDNSGF